MPRYESGDRLRATILDAGDGAVVFQEWFDSELETSCGFNTASDGVSRCLPAVGAEVLYGDAACTELVVAQYPGCGGPPPAYGHLTEFAPVDECGATQLIGTAVYRVGATLGVGSTYRKGADGTCALDTDTNERFAATSEIDPTTFVAETELRVEDRGDGLGRRVRVADDGSIATVDFVDLETDASCFPFQITTDSGNVRACTSNYAIAIEGASTTAVFSDSACTSPAPYVPPCVVPTIIAKYLLQQCQPVEMTLHEVGDEISALYQVVEEACVAAPEAGVSYAVGAELDPTTLPNVEEVELGGGRVRARVDADQDGRPMSLYGTLIDSNTGATCNAMRFEGDASGISRCLPNSVGYVDQNLSTFVDPECTEGLYIHDPGVCDTDAPTIAYRATSEPCATFYEAIVGLSAFSGSTVYVVGAPGTCVATPIANVVTSPTAVALRVGDEVPLEDFPAITTRVE